MSNKVILCQHGNADPETIGVCREAATETWSPRHDRVLNLCAKRAAAMRKWDALFAQFTMERKAPEALS